MIEVRANKSQKAGEFQLPCLMKSEDGKRIYLITDYGKDESFLSGIRLCGPFEIEISNEWVRDCLTPFDGEITLRNKHE